MMSQTSRLSPLQQELMAELIKAKPNHGVVRDRAIRLGFKNVDNLEALMAEILEKGEHLRPKSKRRHAEVMP